MSSKKQSPSPPKDNRAVSPPQGKGATKAPQKAAQKTPEKHAPKAPEPKPAQKPAYKAPEPVKPASKPAVQPSSGKKAFDSKPYIKNGVTEEEVAYIKNAFDLFDSDQGGSVDINELKAAMISLGFESKNGAIFQMIADLDVDGNGNIDFEEWYSLLTKRTNDKDSRASINKIFALFDPDHHGKIDANHLKAVAAQLGENVSDAELEELIHRADVDGDGLVSEEEFYIILTRKIKD